MKVIEITKDCYVARSNPSRIFALSKLVAGQVSFTTRCQLLALSLIKEGVQCGRKLAAGSTDGNIDVEVR